jgi:predicted transglutaminase-like cysteine proteinase
MLCPELHLSLGRSLCLFFIATSAIGCSLGDWRAWAFFSPVLSHSQNAAPPRSDLSASQTVAGRFPSPTPAPQFRYPALAERAALHFLKTFAADGAESHADAKGASSAAPSFDHLIDFRVVPALPPIGHSRFCLHYPADCKVRGIDFRRRNIALTRERWNELDGVNRDVNRGILPDVTPGTGATEEWIISPRLGDCKDYAMTKRHQLLARGWPSRSLLLSEVVLPSGEHHLVLVVRVKGADLVLDNLTDDLRLAAATYDQYVWVRIQSPQNPKFWSRVQKREAVLSRARSGQL